MELEKQIKGHDAFVFDLDNVLYPEKDFLLQVYYLFGQFVEYSEQIEATAILTFMQQTYLEQGHEGVFEKTAIKFNIPEKYKLNFDLLQRNVRLPLKLLLFDAILQFLQAIVVERKPVFLLVSGHPEAQLNKIKQVDWQGLESYLTVYFSEEIAGGQADRGLAYVVDQHQLRGKKLLVIGKDKGAELANPNVTITFLQVDRLFLA